MKKIFSFNKKKQKEKAPVVTLEEATEKINRRGDITDERIKKLDAELLLFSEYIKKTKPGPAQNALKARALRVLKQKKMYEAQRDMLYNQSFKLERVSFATEGIKDARETLAAVKAGSKDLKGTLKALKIEDVDKLQDVITDIVEESNEIQDSLLQGQGVPDHLDEDDVLTELEALEADRKADTRTETKDDPQRQNVEVAQQVPRYQSEGPISGTTTTHQETTQVTADEPDLPALLSRSSIQT